MSDLTSLFENIDKSGRGVCVQASTLGSLEALLDFLKSSKIPVSGINIGPVFKRDVMRAATMLEKAKELACILCFDVSVDKEAEKLAEEMGIRLFKGLLYHLQVFIFGVLTGSSGYHLSSIWLVQGIQCRNYRSKAQRCCSPSRLALPSQDHCCVCQEGSHNSGCWHLRWLTASGYAISCRQNWSCYGKEGHNWPWENVSVIVLHEHFQVSPLALSSSLEINHKTQDVGDLTKTNLHSDFLCLRRSLRNRKPEEELLSKLSTLFISQARCMAVISMIRMKCWVTLPVKVLTSWRSECEEHPFSISWLFRQTNFKTDVSNEEWLLIRALKPVSQIDGFCTLSLTHYSGLVYPDSRVFVFCLDTAILGQIRTVYINAFVHSHVKTSSYQPPT